MKLSGCKSGGHPAGFGLACLEWQRRTPAVLMTISLSAGLGVPAQAETIGGAANTVGIGTTTRLSGAAVDVETSAELHKFATADREMLLADCLFVKEQLRSHPRLLWFNLAVSDLYYLGEFMGMTINLIENYAFWHHPKKMPVWLQESATTPRLAAKTILIFGTGCNMWLEHTERRELRRDGLDIRSLDAHMESLARQTQQFESNLLNCADATARADAMILRDIRDLALLRYIALRKRLIRRGTTESLEQGMTIFNKVEVSLGSDVVRMVDAPLHLGIGGPASISTTFAGAMTGIQGLIANGAAQQIANRATEKYNSRIGLERSYDEVWADWQQKRADRDKTNGDSSTPSASVIAPDGALLSQADTTLRFLEVLNYRLEGRDKSAVRRETFLHVIGTTQGVRGVMAVIAGYPPAKKNKRRATLLLGDAAVPYVAGTGLRFFYGMGRTAAIIAHRGRDKKNGEETSARVNGMIGALESHNGQ